jgi:hypothetical protein
VVNAYSAVLEWPPTFHDHTVIGPLYGGRFERPIVTTNHGPFDGELGDYYAPSAQLSRSSPSPGTRPPAPWTLRSRR